ncbi:uncharacterized protein DUF397 [Lentzea atacamensis]|uniref:Uncharacterized protein DUF397 n=1 Tax=Lentzea atacamensis TaxID=531938 RepID=A0ABX9DUE6_9PSEU|nr:DUF397 domain-containing protein [Lentzea atacamensis]RAS57841.1 uncharacterized protein DUF397 [Lentzea atacamensis]
MINNWRTSSYTEPNGSCVEIGFTAGQNRRAGIRDTKDLDGPMIQPGIGTWLDFVQKVKDGRIIEPA